MLVLGKDRKMRLRKFKVGDKVYLRNWPDTTTQIATVVGRQAPWHMDPYLIQKDGSGVIVAVPAAAMFRIHTTVLS